jgi:hypothetical protein
MLEKQILRHIGLRARVNWREQAWVLKKSVPVLGVWGFEPGILT